MTQVAKSTDTSIPLIVVGGGRMGEAIVAGFIGAGFYVPAEVMVVEPDAARREILESTLGVVCMAEANTTLSRAQLIILAVKPQVIGEVVAGLASHITDALVVSIAAGVSCARLEMLLPPGTAVVRVMPNTPAIVGKGMSVVSGGSSARPEQVGLVCEVFSSLGDAVVLDERHQDAATALSGSGPAYVALFIDALARAGIHHGLPAKVARRLALKTVAGTAALIETTGQQPEQVIDGVASPGGTTIAGIEALESGGVRSAVLAAVTAAVVRAKELGT